MGVTNTKQSRAISAHHIRFRQTCPGSQFLRRTDKRRAHTGPLMYTGTLWHHMGHQAYDLLKSDSELMDSINLKGFFFLKYTGNKLQGR